MAKISAAIAGGDSFRSRRRKAVVCAIAGVAVIAKRPSTAQIQYLRMIANSEKGLASGQGRALSFIRRREARCSRPLKSLIPPCA